MKTECLQTNKAQYYLGKENAWEAVFVLIKSLICAG